VPSLPHVVGRLEPSGVVIFVTNGIPSWYFPDYSGAFYGTRLPRLDPGDRLWNGIYPTASAVRLRTTPRPSQSRAW